MKGCNAKKMSSTVECYNRIGKKRCTKGWDAKSVRRVEKAANDGWSKERSGSAKGKSNQSMGAFCASIKASTRSTRQPQ